MGLAKTLFDLLLAVGVVTPAAQCNAESDDSAQWIWGKRTAARFATAETFDLASAPQRARLKCAVDFCTATVWLNDQAACEFQDAGGLQTIDAVRFLKRGSNQLRLTAETSAGPAAIAYHLEVMLDDGRRIIVRSSDREPENVLRESPPRHALGDVGLEPWWSIRESPSISVFDEYNQWEEAASSTDAGDLAAFQLADGFTIELVASAKAEHGSWVSMAVDESGRVLLGNEEAGILRLTLPGDGRSELVLESLNEDLKGVQGILPTATGLLVSADRSRGLYRLNQVSDETPFGKKTLLRETGGAGGDHGRHDLAQDSKGRIYVVHGDSVQIPEGFTSLVPSTNEFQDKKPADGHVVQTDVDGETWRIFCSGLRNPYGLAFNDAGELFTFDADAEAHTGLPWYRPTRIVHLMPGVDYGWRESGVPWPGYLPDLMPPIVKIGRGSPTALKFAYSSQFPPSYRRALIALDWSYGRILAVHLVPQGSTYLGHAEVLVRGRPFSVCDLDFAKDGSMLVVTGGRSTRSKLYRIRYVGTRAEGPHSSQQAVDRAKFSNEMRALRRRLESSYGERGPTVVRRAWTNLDHHDLGIRSAARILLEHQPSGTWEERLWRERQAATALPALLALVRSGSTELFPRIHQKLLSLSATGASEILLAARIESLIDKGLPKEGKRSQEICEYFEPHFPTARRSVDRELCQLLVEHQSTVVVDRTLDILADEAEQVDQFHYLVCIARATAGWSPDHLDEYLRMLSGARLFLTDEGLGEIIQKLYDGVIRHVPQSQRAKYSAWFMPPSNERDDQAKPLEFINRWTVPQVMRQLGELKHSPDAENGARVFETASCSRCHRFQNAGRPFGPDLSTVVARFSRPYILEQIVSPSKIIPSQYRNYAIALSTGEVIQGQVVHDGFRKSILRVATDPMALHSTTEINKYDIESFQESDVSPMPERLLDTLTIGQIADLLAYLESGGR